MAEKILPRYPMEGVEVWKNQKNRFLVFQLHYSANPLKRDPEYRANVKSVMPIRQYLQEYELQWESYTGKPVYADWNEQLHGSKTELFPELGSPLLRGWDFGLTPACVIAQMQDEKLVVIREFVETNMGADRFSDWVLKQCAIEWPRWFDQKRDWLDFIDPSGMFRKDTDEGTCAKILDSKGLNSIAGPVAWEARRSSVEHFLVKMNKKGPCFQVNMVHCPVLVRGFNGGYRYPETSFEKEPQQIRPIKDEHSHPHDALQYIASGVQKLRPRRKTIIPHPDYSWMRSKEHRHG